MARRTSFVGVEVDGLQESLKALGSVDKALRKEATDAIREHTKPIAQKARKNAARTAPGVPRGSARWIGYSVTAKGAGIVLKSAGASGPDDPRRRAKSAEFGADWQKVGWEDGDDGEHESKPQRELRRRVFNPPRQKGYIIQPTIKRMLPETLDGVADDLAKVYKKALDRAGVPRGS